MTNADQPIVAMIHLPPLPGAGNYSGTPVKRIIDHAVNEAALLQRAGFSWLLVQNTHDAPTRTSVPGSTLAAMSAVGSHVREAFHGQLGVNVHKNDGPGALSIAHAIGASFIRVKALVGLWIGPEGLIPGNAEAVFDLKRQLASEVEIWADLGELTSVPVTDVGRSVLADWAGRFGGADRLIVTEGDIARSAAAVREAKAGSPLPVLIGGRTSPSTVQQALAVGDGVIVGSCLRDGGRTSGKLVEDQVVEYLRAARTTESRPRESVASSAD